MWQWVNAHGRCILYPATNCCIGAIVDYGILLASYRNLYTTTWAFCIVRLDY